MLIVFIYYKIFFKFTFKFYNVFYAFILLTAKKRRPRTKKRISLEKEMHDHPPLHCNKREKET